MNIIGTWRQSATANANRNTRTKGYGVRELRQTPTNIDKAKEKSGGEGSEAKEPTQAKRLTFALAPALPLGTIPLLCGVLPCQTLPSEPTTYDLTNHKSEPLRIRQLAAVVTEGLFVKIPEQVKWLHADIRSVQLPPYQTPEVFHRIRVDVPTCVFYGVIYNVVPIVHAQSVIRFQSIIKQRGTGLNVLPYFPVEFVLPPVRDGKGTDVSATLHHAESDGLILAARPSDDLRSTLCVHVARLAADERFINFNFALQFGSGLILHRFTNSVKHKPSSLLGQPQVTGDFVRTDAVLAVGNKPRSRQPLVQRDRGILEDRPDLNGELPLGVMAAALPAKLVFKEGNLITPTCRTDNTIRPDARN
jgi:hypothetical protein